MYDVFYLLRFGFANGTADADIEDNCIGRECE
jgi:hypothetical protein